MPLNGCSPQLRLSLRRAISMMPPRLFLRNGSRWATRNAVGFNPVRRVSGRAAFAYTWLTNTPDAISPIDIAAGGSLSPGELHVSNPDPYTLLFLVTPRFAHWLDPANPFLQECIRDFYPSSSLPDTLYTVAAIVDKIPGNASPHTASTQGAEVPAQEEYEGISILGAVTENVRGKVAPKRRIGAPSNEEPNLLFTIQNEQNPHSAAHQVGLRLANTIFINEKETTLLGMRWSRDQEQSGGSSSNYTLDQSMDLAGCVFDAASPTIHPSLVLPLDPVSQRRRVITSMGNILRQVAKSTDPGSTAPMPASSELERELPRYIAENNIEDQRVSVWALVETPDVQIAGRESSTQDRLTQSLRQGGKLHRVVSGGGGWGKKQGLLSLDPEVSFTGTARSSELVALDEVFGSNPSTPAEVLPSFDEIMGGDDLSNLSQVAREGDFIQFFVSVEPPTSNTVVDNRNLHGITYRFGVVSDFEEIVTHVSGEGEKSLVSLPHTFGALSEKAITYTQPAVQGLKVFESSTKLDIPGSQVVLSPVY
ncbi:hypothetical protein N7492_008550 [Penicillium capsulatum]|uniref:V-type ATPase n=1 Tax=Penicillium capsulatum TaxID=69766 RepID=A0A9W9HRS2_9EURO|nr:hypothetical protein N7492_008550 [Penicillium capsulatum]KAJ6105955.1 hypothetical protein N7512_009472 [Penicillium capsulatum]